MSDTDVSTNISSVSAESTNAQSSFLYSTDNLYNVENLQWLFLHLFYRLKKINFSVETTSTNSKDFLKNLSTKFVFSIKTWNNINPCEFIWVYEQNSVIILKTTKSQNRPEELPQSRDLNVFLITLGSADINCALVKRIDGLLHNERLWGTNNNMFSSIKFLKFASDTEYSKEDNIAALITLVEDIIEFEDPISSEQDIENMIHSLTKDKLDLAKSQHLEDLKLKLTIEDERDDIIKIFIEQGRHLSLLDDVGFLGKILLANNDKTIKDKIIKHLTLKNTELLPIQVINDIIDLLDQIDLSSENINPFDSIEGKISEKNWHIISIIHSWFKNQPAHELNAIHIEQLIEKITRILFLLLQEYSSIIDNLQNNFSFTWYEKYELVKEQNSLISEVFCCVSAKLFRAQSLSLEQEVSFFLCILFNKISDKLDFFILNILDLNRNFLSINALQCLTEAIPESGFVNQNNQQTLDLLLSVLLKKITILEYYSSRDEQALFSDNLTTRLNSCTEYLLEGFKYDSLDQIYKIFSYLFSNGLSINETQLAFLEKIIEHDRKANKSSVDLLRAVKHYIEFNTDIVIGEEFISKILSFNIHDQNELIVILQLVKKWFLGANTNISTELYKKMESFILCILQKSTEQNLIEVGLKLLSSVLERSFNIEIDDIKNLLRYTVELLEETEQAEEIIRILFSKSLVSKDCLNDTLKSLLNTKSKTGRTFKNLLKSFKLNPSQNDVQTIISNLKKLLAEESIFLHKNIFSLNQEDINKYFTELDIEYSAQIEEFVPKLSIMSKLLKMQTSLAKSRFKASLNIIIKNNIKIDDHIKIDQQNFNVTDFFYTNPSNLWSNKCKNFVTKSSKKLLFTRESLVQQFITLNQDKLENGLLEEKEIVERRLEKIDNSFCRTSIICEQTEKVM